MRNPFRRKTRIGAAIVAMTVVFVVAHGLRQPATGDRERRVMTTLENASPGTFVPLAQMIDGAYDHACVLGPYSRAMTFQYRPDVDRIVKAYMDKVKFSGDEGDWHIVLTQGNRVTILNFKRSGMLDVTRHPTPEAQQLHPKFTAARCAPLPRLRPAQAERPRPRGGKRVKTCEGSRTPRAPPELVFCA
jgi:hypothetical protein